MGTCPKCGYSAGGEVEEDEAEESAEHEAEETTAEEVEEEGMKPASFAEALLRRKKRHGR